MKNTKETQLLYKSSRKQLLMSLLSIIKVATSNKTKDVNIDENLKNELRENFSSLPISIFFSILLISIGLNFLFANITSYLLVAMLYLVYIFEHPFTHLLWLFFKGATLNQIHVMYDRVFRHIFKMRYVLLIPLVFTIIFYFVEYDYSLKFEYIQDFLLTLNLQYQQKNIYLIKVFDYDLNMLDVTYYLAVGIENITKKLNNTLMYCLYMTSYLFITTKFIQIFRRPK